jgi:tetratricopeptide (TPR) repeat protein
VAIDSPHNLDRLQEAADGYMEITKLCLTDPDLAQEIDAAYRRLSESLERWRAELPESASFRYPVAHRYRNWALLVEGNVDCLSQFEDAQRQAIQLFENLVRDDPEMDRTWFYLADGYARLGEALTRSGKADDGKAALERAIEICEQHAADFENIFGSHFIVNLYAFLGNYLSATHRKPQAADYVRAAAENAERMSNPTAATDSLGEIAIVQARLGDKEGYRRTCKAIVAMPFDQLASPDKWRLSWTPCIAPDALDDPSLPVRLGKEFLAGSTAKDRRFALCQLGAAHYRAGQYEQAAERLLEGIAANPPDSSRDEKSINYCRLFLAMTQWQIGGQDEARRLLAETLPAIEKELQSPASQWVRRAILELLRSEAVTLIGQTDTNEAVENENRVRSEE